MKLDSYPVLSMGACSKACALVEGRFRPCVVQGPQEKQEAALEILQSFCRQPSFIVDLYANADCDITCSNTFGARTPICCSKA